VLIVVYIHTYTDSHTSVRTATEAFSRCGVFASRSKALGFQRVRAVRGWWWKRKDRRLKCRFRATLEPRKHLSPLTRITSTPPPLPSFLTLPLLRFTFSPSSTFGIHRFSSSWYSCLSCLLCFPCASPIYLALSLTLRLLEYRPKGYSVTDLDFTGIFA